MKKWRKRRDADIALYKAAKKIRRDKGLPKRIRKYAWLISVAFFIRVFLYWHMPPSKFLTKILGNIRYGEYCGLGYGLDEGKEVAPTDELDAACMNHDKAYL